MHIDLTTLALQALNFLVLVWLLGKFLYKPVLAAIDRRETALADRREQADAALRDSAQERETLATERAALAAETDRLRASARAAADAERAAILADARALADQLRDAGRTRLEQERTDARRTLESQAGEVAVTIATKLLAHTRPEMATRLFIDSLCHDLEALDEAGRARLLNGKGDAHILTAFPLPQAEATALARRIKALLGEGLHLSWGIDPSLIAGVELQFRHHFIRHSWREALAAARDRVTHADHALPGA